MNGSKKQRVHDWDDIIEKQMKWKLTITNLNDE